MKIITIRRGEQAEAQTGGQPQVAAIGFFDGVHRGHQFLIGRVIDEARRAGMASAVVTFDRPPREVLQSGYQPQLLSTLEGKLERLSATQVDNAFVLHFDKSLAALPAQAFMEEVLWRQLRVKKLVIGYDNRFGHGRSEGFADYVRYGQALGMEVISAAAFLPDGQKVSSSVIRAQIERGDVAAANRLLGYAYTFGGDVVSGYQNGRRMGFPTANLDVSACRQLLPAAGVYAVMVRRKDGGWMRGMMNIGRRPTFNGTERSVEVHLFRFSGNLYGQRLLVSLAGRIRDERRFASPDALAQQLAQDRDRAEGLLDDFCRRQGCIPSEP